MCRLLIRSEGGGDTANLTKTKFSPLIASSLAIALGISVIYGADEGITLEIPNKPAGTVSEWNFIWNGVSGSTTGGSNTDAYQPALESGTKPIQNLVFKFATSTSGDGSETTYTASTDKHSITINGGDNALQMNNGSGTLKIDFNGAKNDANTFILDLSGTANNTALTHSFVGNIETSYGASKTYSKTRSFSAIFGKSVKGNITLNSGGRALGGDDGTPNALTFQNGANLEGSLTVGHEDTGVVFEGNGKITENVEKNDGGKLLLTFEGTGGIEGTVKSTAGTTNITYGGGNQNIRFKDDQRGTISFIYGESVDKDSRVINVNELSGSNTSSPTISSGTVVFDGISKVFLNQSSGNAGDGTLYLAPKDSNQNGAIKFLFDNSVGTDQGNPIIKGNINATSGSLIFALKDTDNETGSNPFTNPNAIAPTKTYYVDGNITIANGGLSAFWDNRIGFYGKLSATGQDSSHQPHKIQQTGGFYGKNDAWFEAGSFGPRNNTITTIQATTGGTTHLVFEDIVTIDGVAGDNSNKIAIKSANANCAMLLFKKGATINGDILLYKGHGYNQITLEGDSSSIGSQSAKSNIKVDFPTSGGSYRWVGGNTIVFHSKSNTLNLASINLSGNYNGDTDTTPPTKKRTHIILSFNDSATTNQLSADILSSSLGNIMIGKKLSMVLTSMLQNYLN